MAYRHVVLFRIHDHVPDETITEALERLRRLAAVTAADGEVRLSEDLRKGRVIVEDLTFGTRADLDRFRAHPNHRAMGEQMKEISDWLIADWENSPS